MGAKNKVIAGDYQGHIVSSTFGIVALSKGFTNVQLNKSIVEEYEVIDADEKKSASSAVMRAGVGALFLGPIGLAAGLSAKKKGIYNVALQFKDGKRSLLEIDEKIYKSLIKSMF